jgi:hypothetical protein
MARYTTAIASLLVFGCFDPRFEPEPDAGGLGIHDAGSVDAGGFDAGTPRKQCSAPADAGLFWGIGLLPQGCTHFEGSLIGNSADYSATNVTSLVEIDGRLRLEDRAETLQGFEGLRDVKGQLRLASLPLTSCSAMRELRAVGSLSMSLNYRLQDIEFPALEVIQGDLYIFDNAELRSLSGLRSLRYVGGQLIQGQNPNLSSAALATFIQRVAIDGGVVSR